MEVIRKCGKCEGCRAPVPFEVNNAALGLLEEWIDGSRKLTDENLGKVLRLVERRRYETKVLEDAYMKGVCLFPDMQPQQVDLAMRIRMNELAAFARGE
tara:strand:- start:456 stop:752 length:297 start_codon:yes stop_codon:yes gene_type:complete